MSAATNPPAYQLTISRLTVDKLGVKLYDKVSAVVAELIANGYDADAESVIVSVPLATQLANTKNGKAVDAGFVIEVIDDGHGMTPDEARAYFLRVGTDRRLRNGSTGALSREKKRPVMGRKGIGKLAPFGICRRIEVWSAGGDKTAKGYLVSHFHMDFDNIVKDVDTAVPLDAGKDDNTWSTTRGTRIRLTHFLNKRVPNEETLLRQLAVRFTFAKPDFKIFIQDATTKNSPTVEVLPVNIPVDESTKVDLSKRPVMDDGKQLPVTGWLAMAKQAYKNDELAGVRIYARGKIIGVTRDFNQPAGFTGEFTMRSYLVGVVNAEWLDPDDGEDLVRTDRQDILWDSDYGQLLRQWGAELIKEIARKSAEPRRARVRQTFMERSNFAERASERFSNNSDVARVAVELAEKFGSFAAEDELGSDEYINGLSDFILSVAPHQALIEAFQEFNNEVTKGNATLDDLVDIFDKTQIAELASYAQIAVERVRVIDELEELIKKAPDEKKFQELLAKAPWLIAPSWTVITQNQALKTFKKAFEAYWKDKTEEDIVLAISYEDKRPDFTLVAIEGLLHIVEIKKAKHNLDDDDAERLVNYLEAFEQFFADNKVLANAFANGWRIELVADGEDVKKAPLRRSISGAKSDKKLDRITWLDFLTRTRIVHEQFLDIHDQGKAKKKAKKGGGA